MKKGFEIVLVVLALAAFILIAGGAAGLWNTRPAVSPETITVAYSPFESTALFWVAAEQGFFSENGIIISLKKYDSGAAALDAVVNGEADLCVGTTEFPLVRQAFRGSRVRTLGVIDKGEFISLVANRERIRNISDIRGSRIGTTRGTVADFHLGRFLALHGMGMQDVNLTDVSTPAGWVNDVADGKIDGISTAQPYADAARDRLGDRAMVIPIQSGQPLFALVIARDDWISAHPGSAKRFLASLAKAEDYVSTHPAESREIVRKKLDLDPGSMDMIWQRNQFSLTLDQSLILAMEDEARWQIANNLTDRKTLPDFRSFVYTKSLEEIRPGSVRIIG